MLKDIILNINIDASPHRTTDFAISVARMFAAHLCGIAFAYDVLPPHDDAAAELVNAERQQSKAATEAAISHFNETARGSAVTAESHLLRKPCLMRPTCSPVARGADISILAQANPGELPVLATLIEAALFDSGRPILLVP
jgi:hypothetical protein